MGSLERRLEFLETRRKRREGQPRREALSHLSDEELEALEEELRAEARARGEQPPPNELLEKMKRWEAEAKEQQRTNAEESRRRNREFMTRNRPLVGLPPLESDEQ